MKRHLLFLLICSIGLAACSPQSSTDAPDPVEETALASDDSRSRFLNVRQPTGFVGDAACFDCHEDLYRSYQTHGMAQSYYPLTPENAVEDFSGTVLHHQASGYYYRVYREGDRFLQEEYRVGRDGAKTHRLVREMQYVVGSGSAARTYLTENNGRLYELPVTWYTQPQKWDFSPGYAAHNSRFDRLVPERCMACHNSYPASVPFAEGKYTEVPDGIGCERCHGPGELHVNERLADPEPDGEADYTIVNPAHLPLDRRLDVCQQCHLHGEVSILREGRGPFDFRPSEPLAAHLAIFSEKNEGPSDQINVISHADRMQQSACFLATRGQPNAMDCVTCHDPHEGFRAQGPAYFNTTCLDCHAVEALQAQVAPGAQEDHTAASNCFGCHMPKVEAEDAPHASFTDHWIRVVEERPNVRPLEAHGPVQLEPYFAQDREQPAGALYEGMAYVVYGRQQSDRAAFEQGIALLERALQAQADHGEAQFLLGFARMQLGQIGQAIPALEEAVRLDAGVPERLNALAQAYEAAGRDPTRITRLYERALALQPALADVRLNYGRFLETQDRLDEALVQYEQATEEQPWLAKAHYNLGTAYLQQGAYDQAEAALQRAVELEPKYPEALGNLGLLYAQQDRMDQARHAFEQAVAVAPEHAVALGNLGTFYLNTGRNDEAIRMLRRAVEQDPQYVDGLVNLALAYFRDDRLDEARRYAEQALQISPNDPRAQQILAAL